MRDRQEFSQDADALLRSYLSAADEAESERALVRLISEHAEPVIKTILRRKLPLSAARSDVQSQDVSDLHGDILAQLISKLRACREDATENRIDNFPAYVAVCAYHAYHEHLRQKYPQRWRLKSRLRYLLTHDERLALREASGREWLCGLAAWPERQTLALSEGQLLDMRTHGPTSQAWSIIETQAHERSLSDLLPALFEWANAPLELDALVNLVAGLQGLSEQAASEVSLDEHEELGEQIADPRANIADEVEQRSYLQRLWDEIGQLPLRQRAALLLNLKDTEGGSIALLPLMGIASIRRIAEVLQIPAEQFAQLWNRLPLDDAAIAERLGLTRQQVINLRKSARERLARRMRTGFEER